jgi:hypothetical protein
MTHHTCGKTVSDKLACTGNQRGTSLRSRPAVSWYFASVILIEAVCLLLGSSGDLFSLTPQEILDEHRNRSTVETFRSGVKVTNTKKNKVVSQHFFWMVGTTDANGSSMFLEFDEPEDAKGMRFLLRFPPKGTAGRVRAIVFVPATGVAVPIKMGNELDLGGTGMTPEDFRGFSPVAEGDKRLLQDQKLGGRDCYVIGVYDSGGKQTDEIWLTKDQFLVVKAKKLNTDGTLAREFTVVDFFEAKDGKVWPRKEEIRVPKDGVSILVEQTAGVYNIELPEELFDPAKFYTYQWKSF